MEKVLTRAVVVIVLALSLGGCAVIDFLDGKYAEPNPRGDAYTPSSRGSGNYGRPSGGGHSH